MKPTGDIGVYVHFPFCRARCPYCDFKVDVVRSIPHVEYADAVIAELEHRKQDLSGRDLRSIYFGGGTPSLWDAGCLGRVISAIIDVTGADERLLEITIEANPNNLDRQHFDSFVKARINRFSLGVQSFDNRALKTLGRWHNADQAREALELALSYSELSISFDLIAGVPGQTLDSWIADLALVASYPKAGHVSIYEMTFKGGTPYEHMLKRGTISALDPEVTLAMWQATDQLLATQGYTRYEVSNFSKPGSEAVHNSLYWNGGEYLGLGVAAHSMRVEPNQLVRSENCRDTTRYLAANSADRTLDVVDPITHLRERLFLGVRTITGVQLDCLEDQLEISVPADLVTTLDSFAESGLLQRVGRRYQPTEEGLRMADTIAVELV